MKNKLLSFVVRQAHHPEQSRRAALGLLLGAFVFSFVAPVWAQSVDEKIQALEQELSQLKAEQESMKGEQVELQKQATAAVAALPTFTYRRGAGLVVEAADRAWAIRFFLQHQYYSTFWLDDNRSKNGAVQGAIHPRRLRPRFNYYWDKGFHEFDYWVDILNSTGTTGGPWNAFKANYGAHFEQMSPFLPTLWIGANPSFWMGAADLNMSSFTGPRSEQSLLSQGNGIILATQTRGVVLDWNSVPLGMAEGQLHLGYSIFGQDAFSQLSTTPIKNDNKAFSWGVGVKPFAKVKNPWIQSLELSFGGKVQNMTQDDQPGYAIRTQQTRAQRVTMIATRTRDDGWEYYTPGLIWGYGPYKVYFSGQFDNSHRETSARNNEGNGIRGRGLRIVNELWVWSPKGPLTGSPGTAGSIMVSPLFDRVDVRAPNAMSGCTTATSGCQGAYAINSGIGLWYFPGGAMNFGVIWDHWRVNKANTDVATRIDKGKQGTEVDWNTATLIMRAQW